MVTNICSMQIPYVRVVLYLCWNRSSFCKFYLSTQLTFFRTLIQKRYVLWSNTLSQKFQWYRPFSIPWHLSLHFLKECFRKIGIFMRIIWYYGIIRSGQKWCGKCMVHKFMETILRTKTKTLPLGKLRVCYFFHAMYYSKNMWFPTLLLLPSWTSY